MHNGCHRILAGVARGLKIVPPHLVKPLDCLLIDLPLRRTEIDGNLMDTAYVLTRDFLEGSRYHRLSEYLTEHVGIVNVLRSLSNTENGYLFGQVGRGKQRIASLVCGNRLTEIRVAVGLKLSAFFIAVIDVAAPRDHIVGIVVEQFHLRRKLGDIVSGTRSCFQELIPATAKAIKARLGRCSRCVGYLVALVEYQLYFPVMYPYPPLDLLLILSHSVERNDYKVALLDTGKVGQLFHKYVG